MKIKNIHILLATLILVVATVATTNAQETPKSDMPEVTITHDKKLTKTANGVELEKGKCIVFEIKTVNGGDPRIDAQVTTTLVFDIAQNMEEFDINNDDWEEKQAFILISECRCIDRGYNPIISGTLKGKKIADNKWYIDVDVIAKGIDSGEDRIFKYNGDISPQQ